MDYRYTDVPGEAELWYEEEYYQGEARGHRRRPRPEPEPCPEHAHFFETRVSRVRGHTHMMMGITSGVVGGLDNHRHQYHGWISVDAGHNHAFSGVTGPAIPLRGGGHTHEIMGHTSYDFAHSHTYATRTSGPVDGPSRHY